MDESVLNKHFYRTYIASAQLAIVALGVAFPVILYIVGKLQGVNLQNSMSAYFHATDGSGSDPLMRVWFVGFLFAIGICLIIYKGFSWKENWLLNAAGFAAIMVAIFPTTSDCVVNCPKLTDARFHCFTSIHLSGYR